MPKPAVQEKYSTTNPVVRSLLERFLKQVRAAIAETQPRTLLDVGCGEGELIRQRLAPASARAVGIDLHFEALRLARPGMPVACTSIYQLPFADKSFDTAVSLEVLEHLENPQGAIREIARVARRAAVFSVPYEPYFRLGNLARGKYLGQWGNHPEHIQHWNPSTFGRMLQTHFPKVRVAACFPWIIAVCWLE